MNMVDIFIVFTSEMYQSRLQQYKDCQLLKFRWRVGEIDIPPVVKEMIFLAVSHSGPQLLRLGRQWGVLVEKIERIRQCFNSGTCIHTSSFLIGPASFETRALETCPNRRPKALVS
jgi:hypothetical protein